MREEGERIGLSIKVVEESGTSLGSLLTRPDLSGCLYPNCRMDNAGPSHLRAGANYTGVCEICQKRYRAHWSHLPEGWGNVFTAAINQLTTGDVIGNLLCLSQLSGQWSLPTVTTLNENASTFFLWSGWSVEVVMLKHYAG